MDSEPITEEDLDDLREAIDPSGNCMVCFNPCKSWSNDLFLYTCTCIYRVHPECFKEWRVLTKTNRVCLICRDEFDTFGYVEEEEQEELVPDSSGLSLAAMVVARFHPGIDAEIDAAANQCCLIEKIIRFVIIASMFFCFILSINILLSFVRAFYYEA
jgi:hypothetical protein